MVVQAPPGHQSPRGPSCGLQALPGGAGRGRLELMQCSGEGDVGNSPRHRRERPSRVPWGPRSHPTTPFSPLERLSAPLMPLPPEPGRGLCSPELLIQQSHVWVGVCTCLQQGPGAPTAPHAALRYDLFIVGSPRNQGAAHAVYHRVLQSCRRCLRSSGNECLHAWLCWMLITRIFLFLLK